MHRTADLSGRQYWVDELMRGTGEVAVVDAFLTSVEYLSLYPTSAALHEALSLDVLGLPSVAVSGDLSTPTAAASAYLHADVKNIVDSFYADFLHRPADSLESFWLIPFEGVAAADLKIENTALGILTSAECIGDFTAGAL
jgi:hypothetical protein